MNTAYKGKLTNRELIGYGIGALGEGMSYTLLSTFFMYYCTDLLGITTGFMASMLFVARIFDAFNDPVMGAIAENTRSKRWGKHRHWIFIGAITNAAVLVLMFNPDLARATNPAVWITVFCVLFDITYTIIDVPYYAYAASFLDLKERDKISMAPRLLGGISVLALNAAAIEAVKRLSPGNEGQGFFRLSLIIAAVFILCAVIAVSTMKNREITVQEKKFTFADAFKTLAGNRQLVIIIAVFVLIMAAPTLSQTVALYYFKYVWHNPDAFSIFIMTAGGAMAAALLVYPFAAKKIPRRKIFIISLLISISGYFIMFLAGYFLGNVYFMLPGVFLGLFGFGSMGVFSTVFFVDAVEYGEWKQGYRSENIVFAMLTFLGKFAGAIAALVVGWGLQIAGYISTDEDVKSQFDTTTVIIDQPAGVTTALNILMFAVPPLLIAGALVLYLRKYKLHGAFMDKITADLQAKREKLD